MTNANRKLLANKIRLDRFEEYRVAAAKRDELGTQLVALERRESELQVRLAAIGSPRRSGLMEKAIALISKSSASAASEDEDSLRRELATVRENINVLRMAVQLQAQALAEARYAASAKLCEELRPEHREIQLRLAKALVEVGVAIEDEAQFRQLLNDGDVSSTLRSLDLPLLTDEPAVRHSSWCSWAKQAHKAGLVERKDLPKEWLDRWGDLFLGLRTGLVETAPVKRAASAGIGWN